ncbi:formate dehydrogenase subunit alpha [Gottschalkia purinilytica]|nr:formate dehydrogenase subunit alpha [Gottschalkia purinilytica]
MIDNKMVTVPKGSTIFEVAQKLGIDIPNFCYEKELTSFSGCRICVVEVEGYRNLSTACSTEVLDGMVVYTESKKVIETRKMILDLMLANHPTDCLTCSKVGSCKLQEYCRKYDVKKTSFEGDRKHFPIDDDNPVMERDQSKCILCGKCVRVCKEIQVTGAIDFTDRGFNSKVTTAFDDHLSTENCRMCGQCISVCPTGAIVNKQLKDIFPWEVEKIRTTCPFCGTGCNFDLNVKDGKVVGVTPNEESPVNGTSLCVKGRFHTDLINSPDRITTPLIKKNGKFVKASWEEALSLVTSKLKSIKDEYGGDAIAGLSSARCVNEDNFVFQKMMRLVFDTNNVDHCARTCHAPTVAGLATTLGSGAMTNSIEEVECNEVLFIIGSNATEAHPIIGNKMKKAAKKGAKLIVIDPRRTELADHATLWLPLNSGTDAALVNGIINIIVNKGWHDKEFIETRCEGFENMWETVKNYTPNIVSKITGISEDILYETAKLYANTKKAGIFYTLGITEHTTGTANVINLANLAMVTGHLGIENAGVNPLRGQNNVQGSCDMGALPNCLPGYREISEPESIKLFEEYWNTKLNPNKGLRIPEMLESSIEEKLKAMYVMGEEPVLTDSDANHVKKALSNLEFLVVQDITLTETAKFADVFLPATCYAEKDGTFTNTERRVQRVRKAVEAPGECRLDWKILCDIAKRLGVKGFDYGNVEEIFNEIREVIPTYKGITYERIDKVGLSWPCLTEDHPGTKFLHKETFPRGKGLMLPVEYEPPAELANEEYPVILTTGRMLYHYNVMTRYSNSLDALRPCELAEINPKDAKDLGVKDNEEIRVTSRRGSIVSKVKITDRVKPGMMFMTFHYKESPVNELTNSAYDPVTKTAEYKVTAVKVEKVCD